MTVKILLIGFIFGLDLVCAQNDGKYRPAGGDGRYRGDNDGKYVHQADTFGGSGANFVVNIGGANSNSKASSPNSPVKIPLAPFPFKPPPPPPVKIPFAPSPSIKLSRSGANVNQDEPVTLGAAAADIKILRQEQEEDENGYRYLYETENGIVAEESGQIEKTETGQDAIRATGFYQYIGDDGKLYRVDYTADANGFAATGEHLPTPPPIPPEIQEVLNILATKPPDADTA
ncbi:endocuticle structural glycoprotein SgAbd-1 [Contarinia nasturtii]|uniref:endocuticle structural glycoprotein SgAbd-1 n=1 Tax=Contarinia nasturtii TaxID=265458 RepID=UPI0012D3E183|nr:endocuticle structural glycoprotein SgAbd-1 [Contarinia nasturtii]